MDNVGQIRQLLALLESDVLDDRIRAIEALGEIGDEAALAALRVRLAPASRELQALVVAVGKLKKRLGVK